MILGMLSFTSHARWATFEEAPVAIEFLNRDVEIKADGTFVEIVEIKTKILNEMGRDSAGVFKIYSTPTSEKIEILSAYSESKGKKTNVDKKQIETKPIASRHKGFDDIHQTMVTYPSVNVGDVVYIKYKVTTHKTPTPKNFGQNLFFGMDGVYNKATVTIRSHIPLNFKINDPDKNLHVIETKKGKQQNLTITLVKPCYRAITSEPWISANNMNEKDQIWVSVSSFKTHEEIGKVFQKKYNERKNEPLPKRFQEIKEGAEKIQNPADQINYVTSKLHDLARYFGEWRSVDGGYYPHPLKFLDDKGMGDCKNFSNATAAILTKLGYKANVALVMVGSPMIPSLRLPTGGDFNHAIVKAVAKDGKTFWIEATSDTSMAQGISSVFSGKYALVLSETPIYEMIPEIAFDHASKEQKEIWVVKADGKIERSGMFKWSGECADNLAGMGLFKSPQEIEDSIIRFISKSDDAENKKITLSDLKSRIVPDVLDIKYSFSQENQEFHTNEGMGMPLENANLKDYMLTATDQVGDLILDHPQTIHSVITIKNVKANHLEKLNVKIDSPWIIVTRTCRQVGGDVEVDVITKILKPIITAAEVKSPAFQTMKQEMKKQFQTVALIVTPTAAS